MAQEIIIQGKSVPLTMESSLDPNLVKKALMTFVPFQEWVNKMNKVSVKELSVQSINVQSIDEFRNKSIGFVKFKTVVLNADNKTVPGIVFLRGGSVSVLVVLKSEKDGKEVPVGSASFYEIPAGMLDGDGKCVGVAAKELKEEAQIEVDPDQLVNLTDLAYGKNNPGMCPSPGACDEFIKLFLFRKKVSQEYIDEIEGRIGGLIERGERIVLKVIPLADLWKTCPDSKALSSAYIYSNLKTSKIIEEL